MFIGVQTNFHEFESTEDKLEPDGSGCHAYMVTVSLSASLVVNMTELSFNTIHWCVSDPLPSTVMKGKLLATTTKIIPIQSSHCAVAICNHSSVHGSS